VDYDPAVVSFDELLDVFWTEHSPTSRPPSSQYAHIAFWGDDAQRDAIAASLGRVAEGLGRTVTTQTRALDRFYVAEDYHQKYYLRSEKTLMRDFANMYPDAKDLMNSTAATRVNGYLDGVDDANALVEALDSLGLSQPGRDRLLSLAGRPPGFGAGCTI